MGADRLVRQRAILFEESFHLIDQAESCSKAQVEGSAHLVQRHSEKITTIQAVRCSNST